jgi:parallel beta-helix repeat protein
MKRLLFLVFLFLAAAEVSARSYYVSTTGNDANDGLSPATAWRTLGRANAFTYAANDSILLRRGDVFYGSIVVNRNNITVAAFGTGAKPLISGFTNIATWNNLGNGVYESNVVRAKNHLSMVTLNGRPQAMGRWPNADAPNAGYLVYETAATGSITDDQLSTTTSTNWVGAEICIRKNGWAIDRCFITGQQGNTFTYRTGRTVNAGNAPVINTAKPNHGYFIMDDPRTLDQMGEWWYDTLNNKLRMFFGNTNPNNYQVRVATLDTLVNLGNRQSVTVDGISLEGSNLSALFALHGNTVSVKNVDITNVGARGVQIFNTPNVLLDGVRTTNILSNSIQVINRATTNVVIRNCVVKNNAQYAGMGSYFEDNDYKAVFAVVSSNLLIEKNVVDSSGLCGIQFNGSDVMVRNNFISNYCYVLHDNGGIYTFANGTDANPGTNFTNRRVTGNIITAGIGAPFGISTPSKLCAGIYLDGRTMNVMVDNNTVFGIAKNGIHCNNPINITIRNNTFFNNPQDISFRRWEYGAIRNLNIKRNISFPLENTQRNIFYSNEGLYVPNVGNTVEADIKALGSIDSNYYHTFSDASIVTEFFSSSVNPQLVPTTPFSLASWKALTGFDANAKRPAQAIQPYTVNSLIGANRFSNSSFNTGITGITAFGTGVNTTWDNSSRLTGVGSLMISFSQPQGNRFGLLHSGIGEVSSTKKYILRFSTYGTNIAGMVRAHIRQTASPYGLLTTRQVKTFGQGRTNHEFLFDGPVSQSAASFVIEVEQTSGTTFIDDIQFFEANVSINTPESQVRLEYNASDNVKHVVLDGVYVGVDSTIYNGHALINPYSSRILVKRGPLDSLPEAIAGEDRVLSMPIDRITLNGVGLGSIVNYQWSRISGPSDITFDNPGSTTVNVTGLQAGAYYFQLRVTNSVGASAFDTVMIRINGVLPVTLIDFNARLSARKVMAQWKTTSEINSSHYDVQRSTDGRSFETIGRVTSNNSSSTISHYNFTDANPVAGVSFYRLAMVDRDGTTAYSRTATVTLRNDKAFGIESIAVTSSAGIKLSLNSAVQQPVSIIVADAAGRVLHNRQVQLTQGFNLISADVRAMNTGVYYVKVFTADQSESRTILSEK